MDHPVGRNGLLRPRQARALSFVAVIVLGWSGPMLLAPPWRLFGFGWVTLDYHEDWSKEESTKLLHRA